MNRLPKMTAAREASAFRYLRLMQRLGKEPFALAWVYDQAGCNFKLLVLAMPFGDGAIEETGGYHAAVRAMLAQDLDAPASILAIDDRHPRGTALRKSILMLQQANGASRSLTIGNFILLHSWIYHVARRGPPPKWRRERV